LYKFSRRDQLKKKEQLATFLKSFQSKTNWKKKLVGWSVVSPCSQSISWQPTIVLEKGNEQFARTEKSI
jgi:uncharacterized membrane protein